MINCAKMNFKEFGDNRGNLVAIENQKNIPFDIERIYYIYDVPNGIERGFHSHRDLEQILIALGGSIKIRIKTPTETEIVELNSPNEGLYIGSMIWREMFDFTPGSTLLALASHKYDESDYIRDYKQYLKEAKEFFEHMNSMKEYLQSKNITLDFVQECDADFLYQLRTNSELNKYLSPVSGDVESQKQWIKNYKFREYAGKEYYFKVSSKEGKDLGFVRLYNIDYEKKVLTFGSIIMCEDHPKYSALEAMICTMRVAFEYLEMNKVILDVRVNNERAKKLYNRFGFEKYDENELDEFYEISAKKFAKEYKKVYHTYIGG